MTEEPTEEEEKKFEQEEKNGEEPGEEMKLHSRFGWVLGVRWTIADYPFKSGTEET